MIPPLASHAQKVLSAERRSRNFDRSKNRSRSPAGPRRLGPATRISASLFRGSLRSSGAHPAKTQKRQSLPFYPLATQGFRTAQNSPRVVTAPPSETAPVSACKPLCARFRVRVACVPAFACESKRGPFVGEVEKRDEKRSGTALVTAVLLEFPPLLDDGGSQRTGKCMYIKAWWNKRDIAGSTRPRCGRGREGPLFRRVCRCVRFFEQSRVCTRRSPLKRTLRRLWEKLKDAMKSGLKQRCDGNFRTIFAGTILSEKPNFLSRIFGRGRPFDFSTR